MEMTDAAIAMTGATLLVLIGIKVWFVIPEEPVNGVELLFGAGGFVAAAYGLSGWI